MAKLTFNARIRITGVNPYVQVSAARAKTFKPGWRKPLPVLVRINGQPRTPWRINMMPGRGAIFRRLQQELPVDPQLSGFALGLLFAAAKIGLIGTVGSESRGGGLGASSSTLKAHCLTPGASTNGSRAWSRAPITSGRSSRNWRTIKPC